MKIFAVQGDITEQTFDAIVNAANTRMRGGGGVDGAIHRAGGITVLQDCIDRFPDGLATGDAGWTTAGNLPAKWVIHTVGPNYAAGQRDRTLLESCYRRSLQVADELGAKTLAVPLISSGIYGWPENDAVRVAVQTLSDSKTSVERVHVVSFSEKMHNMVRAELKLQKALNILHAVRLLHERGMHGLRVLPGMSPSGAFWRIAISNAENYIVEHGHIHFKHHPQPNHPDPKFFGFSTADSDSSFVLDVEELAEQIFETLAPIQVDDTAYAQWFAGLLELCEKHRALPIAYSDSYNPPPGWEIGWGSGITYPDPPSQ